MTPRQIYDIYKRIAPEKAADTMWYKRLTPNSILVKQTNQKVFIFETDSKGESFSFSDRKRGLKK